MREAVISRMSTWYWCYLDTTTGRPRAPSLPVHLSVSDLPVCKMTDLHVSQSNNSEGKKWRKLFDLYASIYGKQISRRAKAASEITELLINMVCWWSKFDFNQCRLSWHWTAKFKLIKHKPRTLPHELIHIRWAASWTLHPVSSLQQMINFS